MAKVVISGYYGSNNVGDEAILMAMKDALLHYDPQVEIVVISARPEQTQEQYGVKAIARTDFVSIYRTLKHADLLISGGGSLLQDVTSHRSLRYYLGIMTLARLAKCPIMLYAHGIGPIKNKYNRWLTAKVVNGAKTITVRDPASAQELIKLGITRPAVHITADPVVALHPAEPEVGRTILEQAGVALDGQGPLVGISVRAWKGKDIFASKAAASLDKLVENGEARLVFIPMQLPEDLEMITHLRRMMKHGDETKVLSCHYHAQELLSAMGHLDLLVAVRLHALIFAAVMNVPFLGISYDPKVDQFVQLTGQRLVGSMEEFSGQRFYRALLEARDEGAIQESKAQLARTIANLRLAALENARLAMEQVRGR